MLSQNIVKFCVVFCGFIILNTVVDFVSVAYGQSGCSSVERMHKMQSSTVEFLLASSISEDDDVEEQDHHDVVVDS